ncbi:hypothetical protein EVAR_67142_1 [Eumeta japonica]|uniref:Uncharacterized protein n=1 Tax=Eumeta variegata TaxID=151549 RepID=A0A4C1ZY12_EUMVA|nr:hypothetical protein EVAR_67142_1 [Eumeta japonica]
MEGQVKSLPFPRAVERGALARRARRGDTKQTCNFISNGAVLIRAESSGPFFSFRSQLHISVRGAVMVLLFPRFIPARRQIGPDSGKWIRRELFMRGRRRHSARLCPPPRPAPVIIRGENAIIYVRSRRAGGGSAGRRLGRPERLVFIIIGTAAQTAPLERSDKHSRYGSHLDASP